MNTVERSARWLKHKCGLGDDSAVTVAVRPYYDQFLATLFQHRGLPRRLYGDEEIRIRPAHRNYSDEHEPEVFEYLRNAIRPGETIIEVGANVGIFTVLLARWIAPHGHVFAFEPAPEARAALKDHLALNHIERFVTLVSEAVGGKRGFADFYIDGASGQNTLSTVHSRIPTAKRISVPVNTLDAFCTENNLKPSLIKIDVEGFEHLVLQGALQTLMSERPRVVVEFHPMLWEETGATPIEIQNLLQTARYKCRGLSGQRDIWRDYGHVLLELRELGSE